MSKRIMFCNSQARKLFDKLTADGEKLKSSRKVLQTPRFA